jgi:uncharacterized membrane protein YfcA
MIVIVMLLIGLSKGGLGGALAGLSTALLAIVMPPHQVIGLLLPILIIADVFTLAAHWQLWDQRLVLLLLPGAVIGVAIGTLFITSITPETLRRGIGLIVLLFVIYKLFENRLQTSFHYRSRNWHGLLAGSLAGVSSTLAHTGPPPITIYLLMQNISPRTFVATSALFFAVLNWVKVPSYFYADLFDFKLLLQTAWLLPLLPASIWFGKRIVTRVDKVIFDRIIVVLLACSAVLLLFR